MFSKKRTIGQQMLAILLSLVMVLTMAGVPSGQVEAANANENTSDKKTYTGSEQGITMKLFNYSNKINYVLKENAGASTTLTESDYELRKIAPYFNFRGDGNNGVGSDTNLVLPVPTRNDTYDVDGYTSNHATVERTLDEDGFPVLDLSRHTTTDGSGETVTAIDPGLAEAERSLAYLFSAGDDAVTEYAPKNTLLLVDEDDPTHFYYNSKKNAVDYDIKNNLFRVRNYTERTQSTAGSAGGYCDYLPFNYTGGTKVGTNSSTKQDYHVKTEDVDYWFGTTMEVEFFQTKDGLIGTDAMTFSFSGDDDVWVFIDDVLVLDLGGTHGTVDGSIDFSTGKVLQYLTWGGKNSTESAKRDGSDTSFPTSLKACFEAAERTPNGGWNEEGTTFADYTKHTLKFYYLERGSSVANCKIDFRLCTLPEKSLTVTKQLSAAETEDETEVREYIEDSLTYKFRVLKAADGNATDDLFVKPGTKYSIIEKGQITGTGAVGDDGYFTLKAGQSAQFLKMLELGEGATEYVVEEVMPTSLTGQYGGVEYSVAKDTGTVTKEGEESKSSEFTGYRTDVLSAENTQTVTYNNKVDTTQLGVLKITKELAAGAKFTEGKNFDIQVKLGEELLPVGTKYTVGEETRSVENEGIISLAIGETATLVQGLLSGTAYEIVELGQDGFHASYRGTVTTGGNTVACEYDTEKASGEFPLAGVVHVTVTNANYDFKCEVPISKQALNNNAEATFDFAVEWVDEQVDEQGKKTYKTIEELPGSNITVTDGTVQNSKIVIGYQAGTDGTYYYKITEKPGEQSFIYDKTYYIVQITVDGDSSSATLDGIWKNGAEEVEAASFVNQKAGSILVRKIVEGTDSDSKFDFTVKITNEDGTLDEFKLGNGEERLIENIPVGAEVIVTEAMTATAGYVPYYKVGTDDYKEGSSVNVTVVPETTEIEYKNVAYPALKEDAIVIDYGKPIEIDVLKNDDGATDYGYKKTVVGFVSKGENDEQPLYFSSLDKIEEKYKSSNGTYEITTEGKVLFTLTRMLSEVEKINVVVKIAKGGHEFYTYNSLNIIPANIMYYETDFADDVFELKTTGREWDDAKIADDHVADDPQNDGTIGQNLYGYDSTYENDTYLSNGSSYKVEGAGVKKTLAKFSFTGTGFDLISRTGAKQGAIRVDIYSDAERTALEKSITVLNKSESKLELYQIPVVSAEMSEYGTYYVTIGVNAAYENKTYPTLSRGGEFYFDAIRVYNTIGDKNDGHKDYALANAAYMADNEANMELKEVRNMLLSGDADIQLNGENKSVVFVDRKYTTEKDGKIVEAGVGLADYTNIGPNNEVYLVGSQVIGFGIRADKETKPTSIDIGVKSVNGQSAYLNVCVWSGKEDEPVLVAEVKKEIESSTVQFYDLLGNKNLAKLLKNYGVLYVTIDNLGEGILSITDLKIAYGNGGMNASVFVNERAVEYVLARAASYIEEEQINYDVIGAEFTKTSMKRNTTATLTITTSEAVENLEITNKAGKQQTFTVESAEDMDGVKTWTVQFKISSMGTQTFTIAGYGANGETGSTTTAAILVTR